MELTTLQAKAFRYNLQTLRSFHKLTQDELGELIGVAGSTVSNYETGKSDPDPSKLIALSILFGISINDLVSHDLWERKDLIQMELHAVPGEYKIKRVYKRKETEGKGVAENKEVVAFALTVTAASLGFFSRLSAAIKVLKLGKEVHIRRLSGVQETD